MLAKELLSARLFPLKVTDTCGKALEILNDYDVAFLPVVENEKHIGYVSASSLSGASSKENIKKYINNSAEATVYAGQHLFQVIVVFSQINSAIVSVVDDENKFIGIISAKELINKMASLNAFSQPGSIMTLEMPLIDYSLSEITRIIEYNNARILSLYVHTVPEAPSLLHVHLKLNVSDIKSITATFERYNYVIVATYFKDDEYDNMKSRYDSLMKYLDI